MLVQFSKTVVAVAVSSALTLAWGQAQQPQQPAPQGQPQAQTQQPGQKNWKDRPEYDLYQSIIKETDPTKKLALLDQWREKYPNSDFKVERLVQYLDTYRALGQAQKMWDTAKQILAEDPKNVGALYWTSLLVTTPGMSPADLDLAEKAARSLATNVDQLKPAGVSDADWQNTKNQLKLEAVGHRAEGYIALQRKNYEAAAAELTANLKLNPADAQASYWLGTALLGQKKPELQSDALYEFARAAAYDGPGALEPKARQQALNYITKTYTAYHGQDPQGLQELLAAAKQNALPPPNFKILSEEEVKEQHHAAIAKEDPSLGFWVKLKDALQNDPAYFDSGMKDALIPPEGQPALRGYVISQSPAKAPKEIVVGIVDPKTPEATVTLIEGAMPASVEPGTLIHFRGVAKKFQKEPFMVTFEAERKNITGWPTPAGKKAAAKKGAGGSKKK